MRCAAGPRDRRVALERQPGGVREQVPHRRAGRAGGLVEVDDPLLRGDEHGDRRRELRHRGPREGPLHVAERGLGAAGDGDGGDARTATPRFAAERLHRVDTIRVDRQLDLLRCRLRGARGLLARRARRQPGVGLRDGADHARRRRPARRPLRAGAHLHRDHRARALAEAGASLDDVVRTRIYVTSAEHIDAVGRAHRAASAPRGRRRPASWRSCSTRAGSSRSRPRRSL